jgi:hypothetical protein
MARCRPLSEVTATNVPEVENFDGVENIVEVAQTIGGDEVPVAFMDEAHVSSMGGTDDSVGGDGDAIDNKNSQTYIFGASTITLGRIKEMVEKGYFTDGEGWVPKAEAVSEPDDDKAVVYEDFLFMDCACLHILLWLIFY